jgi:hypothetical protein
MGAQISETMPSASAVCRGRVVRVRAVIADHDRAVLVDRDAADALAESEVQVEERQVAEAVDHSGGEPWAILLHESEPGEICAQQLGGPIDDQLQDGVEVSILAVQPRGDPEERLICLSWRRRGTRFAVHGTGLRVVVLVEHPRPFFDTSCLAEVRSPHLCVLRQTREVGAPALAMTGRKYDRIFAPFSAAQGMAASLRFSAMGGISRCG